jgi:hypothetical protein
MSRTKNIIGRLPHFYQSDEEGNHLYRLIAVFGALLDEAEEDLLKVMRAHWINTADNEGSKGFDTSQKGDLDKILSLYLENLGGTSLLRQTKRKTGDQGVADDRIYRERMMGLIQVLLNGASTKAGVREIVGANLGILGNTAEAKYVREKIRIEEFLPEIRTTVHSEGEIFGLISVLNPNPEPTRPDFIVTLSNFGFALIKPKILHLQSGASWGYDGVLSGNDRLSFFNDGSGNYTNNSENKSFEAEQQLGGISFQPGENDFLLSADYGTAQGRFDSTPFDYAHFDNEDNYAIGSFPRGAFDSSRFDNALFDARFSAGIFNISRFDEAVFPDTVKFGTIEVRQKILKPASFSVIVPWDIPGYTVEFELPENALSATEVVLNKLAISDIAEKILNNLKEVKEKQSNLSLIMKALEGLPEIHFRAVMDALYNGLTPGEDLFKDFTVNPRNQIEFIVDKVKGAGIYAVVFFEKRLSDVHDIADELTLKGIVETISVHEMDDSVDGLDIALDAVSGTIRHEIKEELYFIGVFDYAANFDDRFCFG